MAKRQISSLIVSASIWTLFQSITNLTVASLGITVYRCGLEMTRNRVEYALYVVYFFSTSCGNTIDLSLLAPSSQGVASLVVTPLTVDRTLRWMIIQLVIAGLWIVTSLLMMVGSLNRVSGGYSLFFYGPWLVCAALAIFSDAIACIIYIIDIPQTMDVSKLLHFIGATVPAEGLAVGASTWSASAIMAGYFGRGFVFWVTNVFFLIAVIRESRRMAAISNKNTELNADQQAVLNNNTPVMNPTREWVKSNAHYNDLTDSNQMYLDKQTVADANWRIVPHARDVQRSNATPRSSSASNPTLSQRQNDITRDNSIVSLPKRSDSTITRETRNSTSPTKILKDLEKRTKYAYGSNHVNDTRQEYEKPSHSVVARNQRNSANSKYNNNYLEQPNENKQAVRTSVTSAPIELRGQLPWSYLQEATPISAVSRGMREQLPEDEELPPVPVPDYTLHFPHRKRREGIQRDTSSASNHSRPRSPTLPYGIRSNSNKQGRKWGEVLY